MRERSALDPDGARLRCLASHQRARPSRKPIAEFVANKPKALSAGTTVELGTKTRSEGRAVLVSAKTMPCPNKLCPRLARNGASCRQQSLVGAFATLVVARWRIIERTRHMAPNDAKQRQPTPQNANGGQAATTRDEKRQEVSLVGSFIPAVVSRSDCSREGSVRRPKAFR